jgi:hypothetical protein
LPEYAEGTATGKDVFLPRSIFEKRTSTASGPNERPGGPTNQIRLRPVLGAVGLRAHPFAQSHVKPMSGWQRRKEAAASGGSTTPDTTLDERELAARGDVL